MLPGLIDNHTHLADGNSLENGGDPFLVLKKTASQIVLESVPNASKTLLSGFTTVRDVGTYRALNDIALRDAIARGDIVGPRMYVAGSLCHDHGRRRRDDRAGSRYPATVGSALWGGKRLLGDSAQDLIIGA